MEELLIVYGKFTLIKENRNANTNVMHARINLPLFSKWIDFFPFQIRVFIAKTKKWWIL